MHETFSFCREIPLDLWEEMTRVEFQPSTNGQIVKVLFDRLNFTFTCNYIFFENYYLV